MRRAVPITVTVLGLVVLTGAAVIRGVVAPQMSVLPADTDTTRAYTGTAAALLDPSAVVSGSLDKVVLHGVPITVTHRTKVLGTRFDAALVSDSKTVKAAGKTVADVTYRYAVDRTSLGLGDGYSGLQTQTGLTFNWPIRTSAHDYTGWVVDTQKSTSLSYQGKQQHAGVTTFVFTTSTQPALITDPQVLSSLPQAMPRSTLTTLAPIMGITSLPATLPETVPLAYTYRVDATYWVAPRSGIVVDLKQHEVRSVGVANGTSLPAITAPVMDIAFTSTPATLKAAAQDARDASRALQLINTTLPLVLLLLGSLLLGLGLFLLLTRSAHPVHAPKPERVLVDIS